MAIEPVPCAYWPAWTPIAIALAFWPDIPAWLPYAIAPVAWLYVPANDPMFVGIPNVPA